MIYYILNEGNDISDTEYYLIFLKYLIIKILMKMRTKYYPYIELGWYST